MRETTGDDHHLGLRLFDRNRGFEPRDGSKVLRRPRLWRCTGDRDWNPEVGVVRKSEARRQDADDRTDSEDADGPTEGARIAAIVALPIRVADHDGAGRSRLRFVERELPPDDRLDRKDTKEFRTHWCDGCVFGIRTRQDGNFPRVVVRHRFKRGTLGAPVVEVRDRNLF